ncbi:hypothetical protein T4B_5113, partial [Trichinella pseudospiralis]
LRAAIMNVKQTVLVNAPGRVQKTIRQRAPANGACQHVQRRLEAVYV